MLKKLIITLLILLFPVSVEAAAISWTGAGGDADWYNTLNWNPSGSPNSTSTVSITNANGSLVRIDRGAAQANTITLDSANNKGVLILSGVGTSLTLVDSSSKFYVGGTGRGEFYVLDGAHFTTAAATDVLIATSTGSGYMQVSGAGSLATFSNSFGNPYPASVNIGSHGTGVLDILDGGRVDATLSTAWTIISPLTPASNGGVGIINVTGVGSILDTREIHVGYCNPGYLNITDGGVVNSTSAAISSHTTSNSSNGNVVISGVGSAWNITAPGGTGVLNMTRNSSAVRKGSVTVKDGGRLTADVISSTSAFGPRNMQLNVRGSDVTVETGRLVYSLAFSTNFYLDSDVVSVIDVTGTSTVGLVGTHTIAPDFGFSSVTQKTFNVIEATAFASTFVVDPTCPFTAAVVNSSVHGKAVQITFNDSHYNMNHWNYPTTHIFEGGLEMGWIKLEKPDAYAGTVATFLDGGNNLSMEISLLLETYLNETMAGGPGVSFYRQNQFTVGTDASFFGENDFVYFGWDLAEFNQTHGTNIRLMSLEAPEPGTWALLLTGGAFLLRFRRKFFSRD